MTFDGDFSGTGLGDKQATVLIALNLGMYHRSELINVKLS